MKKGIGGHQSHDSNTNEYITPEWVILALGKFDLDPCSPIIKPRPTARVHYTITDDGLTKDWGIERVWLNPPYSNKEITPWLAKMSRHPNGILLTFNRSDRQDHHGFIYPVADSMLIKKGRITFENNYGQPYPANGGAPNIFFAYGENNSDAIADSNIEGHHIPLNRAFVVVVGTSPSWSDVVAIAVKRNGGEADVKKVYDLVEQLAPDKCRANPFWKQKIRQKLQYHFDRISKGYYIQKKTG